MAEVATLVTAVEGPNGTAEVHEVPENLPGGGQRFGYSVIRSDKRDVILRCQ